MLENSIKRAAAIWTAGCNVNLSYGGKSETGIGDITIGWSAELNAPMDGVMKNGKILGVARRGELLLDANRLSPALLDRVILHEVGHALGIGHLEDSRSVMFFQANSSSTTLSDSDKKSCNQAIKTRHGIGTE